MGGGGMGDPPDGGSIFAPQKPQKRLSSGVV